MPAPEEDNFDWDIAPPEPEPDPDGTIEAEMRQSVVLPAAVVLRRHDNLLINRTSTCVSLPMARADQGAR